MREQTQWRVAWQQVLHNKQGIVSGLILLTFVSIGLLDSIHFRLSIGSSTISLLDYLLWPLGHASEESYSSPFSLHLFVKKMSLDAAGQMVFEYPRLAWINPAITNISQQLTNIENIVFFALLKATITWVILFGLLWMGCRIKHKCWKKAWQHLWRNQAKKVPWRTFLITLAVIITIIFCTTDLAMHYHIMGTDKIGTDVFYQGIKSIRTGLIIGTVTSLFMLPVALMGGMLAGYFRGWVDDVIQYIYSTLNAIPSVLLIAAAALVLQLYIMQHVDWFPTVEQRADARLLMICMVLGLTNWTTLCRILRGETLKLRETEYVLAARALGVSNLMILWRHILPNVLPLVLVVIVLDFSGFVLIEAVLSYVGVGVDPTTNSWGNMINQARLELAREPIVWWSLSTAFVLMFALVLAANLFADKVRDAFDPKLQQI
jgi:peptide/nickel transport system permease protein